MYEYKLIEDHYFNESNTDEDEIIPEYIRMDSGAVHHIKKARKSFCLQESKLEARILSGKWTATDVNTLIDGYRINFEKISHSKYQLEKAKTLFLQVCDMPQVKDDSHFWKSAFKLFMTLKDPKIAFKYANKAITLMNAQGSIPHNKFCRLGYSICIADIYYDFARYYQKVSYPNSLHYYKKAINCIENDNTQHGLVLKAASLYKLGLLEQENFFFKESIFILQKSLSIYQNLDNSQGVVLCSSDIGKSHMKLGHFMQAEYWFLQGITESSYLGYTDAATVRVYYNLGCLYDKQNLLERSLSLFMHTMKLSYIKRRNMSYIDVYKKTVFMIDNIEHKIKHKNKISPQSLQSQDETKTKKSTLKKIWSKIRGKEQPKTLEAPPPLLRPPSMPIRRSLGHKSSFRENRYYEIVPNDSFLPSTILESKPVFIPSG